MSNNDVSFVKGGLVAIYNLSESVRLDVRWASKILKDYLLGGHLISSRMDTLEKRVSQVEEKMDLFVNASEESANQERPTWLLAVCKAHQPADPCLKIGVFAA